MEKDEIVVALNKLVGVNHDTRDMYQTAAEAVDNPDYQSLFREFASQRAEFMNELSALVASYGGEPDTDGSLTAALQRTWIDLKAAITSDEETAVIAEYERGDRVALEAYQEAMASDVPEAARSLIRHQFSYVRIAYERMRDLHAALSEGH